MGFSLGRYIILAWFGVGLPALVVFVAWRGLRTGDPTYRLLARRWERVLGVLFAVGAVSGTILSIELGVLWSGLMTDGAAAGIVSALGLLFLHNDAPAVAHGLAHRALPLVIVSGVGGLASLALLYAGHFLTARITAALAVAAVLWAWAVAQYPHLLDPGLTISQAAANDTDLKAVLISLGVGALVLAPSLAWLYLLFQRNPADPR